MGIIPVLRLSKARIVLDSKLVHTATVALLYFGTVALLHFGKSQKHLEPLRNYLTSVVFFLLPVMMHLVETEIMGGTY